MKRVPVLESKIQSKILSYLRTVPGCWAVKVVEANRRGCPDILACANGRFIALEVKSSTGRLSVLQQAEGRLIKITGGEWHVVRSVDDVKEILK